MLFDDRHEQNSEGVEKAEDGAIGESRGEAHDPAPAPVADRMLFLRGVLLILPVLSHDAKVRL